jgi:hypothetical protein
MKTEEEFKKLKESLESEHNREFTDEEVEKALDDLKVYARILYSFAEKELRLENLLKANPRGFHFDSKNGKCQICEEDAFGENSWYDQYGLKCAVCQNAINNNVIPAEIANSRDSWYSSNELEDYFNISRSELNRHVKGGFLKPRNITTSKGKVHLRLFLLEDNKSALPPKELVSGKIITVDRNGEQYFTFAMWYEHIDDGGLERLKEYGIFNYLPDAFAKPLINGGHFYCKVVNPLFVPKK